MEKEYIAGESQRYEIGGRVFIVEPRYRKDGESMADILLKLRCLPTWTKRCEQQIKLQRTKIESINLAVSKRFLF